MAAPLKQITVVCTGNVCRSPMGERLLAHALAAEPEPWNQIQVLSAGVSAYPGDPASQNSVKALEKVGLDLSNHRSRRLSAQLYDTTDLFLVMTESHRSIISQLFPDEPKPILLFRELGNFEDPEVIDPYGGPLNLYLETRDNLAVAIPSIVEFIKQKYA